MIHYSCDLCGRNLDPEQEARYTVKIEVELACDVTSDEAEDDRDHLLELSTMLEQLDDEAVADAAPQRMHFDLCCDCRQRFVRSPLGKELGKQLDFSNN